MPLLLSRSRPWRAFLVVFLLLLLGFGGWFLFTILSTEHHIRQAQQALSRQRYQQALDEFTQALYYRPRSAELHLLAGRTARQAAHYQTAREHLEQCRKLQQGSTEDQQLEELLLRALTGELEQVEGALLPYLYEERPQTPLVLETLAHAYIATYQSERAGGCLHRWLELEPNNVEALYLQGIWNARRLNQSGAITSYQRALEIDPERLPARLELAETLLEQGSYADAAEQYDAALHQKPDEFKARLGLAQCYVAMGRAPEAGPLVDALSQKDAENPDVLWLKGRLAMFDEHWEVAAQCFRNALARVAGHRQSCYQLILCLQRLGREDEASKQSAVLQQIERDQDRLLAIATQEMSRSPRDPALHCELGEIYLRLGRPQLGLPWLHRALRIDPTYRPAHERLLDYYRHLGSEGAEKAEYHRQQLAALPQSHLQGSSLPGSRDSRSK